MIPAEAYPVFYLVLVAVAVFFVFLLVERIRTSPMGRTLRAIREDDVVAEVMGKDVLRHLEPVPEKCGRFSDKDRLKSKGLEPVPEKCGRFSDKDRLRIKGIEHFR